MMAPCRRQVVTICGAFALTAYSCGDAREPVTWTASLEGAKTVTPGAVLRVRVRAKTAEGWYVYSISQPRGGPTPTRIWIADTAAFRQAGAATGPEPTTSFDKTFGVNVEKYLSGPSFVVPLRVATTADTGATAIRVSALYQACNDTICLSPKSVTMEVPVTIRSL